MHHTLWSFFTRELNKAADFCCQKLTIDMPQDDIYERLIGDSATLAAFARGK